MLAAVDTLTAARLAQATITSRAEQSQQPGPLVEKSADTLTIFIKYVGILFITSQNIWPNSVQRKHKIYLTFSRLISTDRVRRAASGRWSHAREKNGQNIQSNGQKQGRKVNIGGISGSEFECKCYENMQQMSCGLYNSLQGAQKENSIVRLLQCDTSAQQ